MFRHCMILMGYIAVTRLVNISVLFANDSIVNTMVRTGERQSFPELIEGIEQQSVNIESKEKTADMPSVGSIME